MAIVLETERLVIRRLRDADLDDLCALTADLEVMKFVGDGRPLTRAETDEWIRNSYVNYERYGFGTWAVTLRADERLVGWAGLIRPTEQGEAEMIYGIAKDLWGRGLMKEAAAALMRAGFADLGLRRIIATIDPENAASIAIVERLGLEFEAKRIDDNGLPELLYAAGSDI